MKRNLVLLNIGWLDRDWAPNPNLVQTLSSLCPDFVQQSQKYKFCPIPVQQCATMSSLCQVAVHILSNQRLSDRLWT